MPRPGIVRHLRGVTGIYRITNTASGKIYIGSAVDVAHRWYIHMGELRDGVHSNAHLQKSWNKYGEASFSLSVLKECDRESLIAEEQIAIDAAVAEVGWSNMYNILRVANSSIGYKHTEEAIAKMREIQSRRFKERPMSDECKAKIGAAHLGQKRSTETRQNISSALRRSETLSTSVKRVWDGRSDEERESIRAKHRKPRNEATRARMRAAQAARKEENRASTKSWWASLSDVDRSEFLARRGLRVAEANKARTPEQRAAVVAKAKATIALRKALMSSEGVNDGAS